MKKEQLLPKEVLDKLPKLGETESQKNPLAIVKFFFPDFDWQWYVVEFDGEDLFYGLVHGFEKELGYFRLSELMSNRGKLGCKIQKDLYFEPTPVNELLS